MDRVKRKKLLSIVISILIAIGLWIYVMNHENPTQTRNFNDVPVELLNAGSLEDRGLIPGEMMQSKVSVRVEGSRGTIRTLTKSDIVASVDLSGCEEGDNYAEISVHLPSSVKVEQTNPTELKISVEKILTKDKEVEVRFNGASPETEEAVCTEQSTELVSVSGPKSKVNSVDRLVAVIPTGELGVSPGQFTATLTPVDAQGHEVENVTASINEVTVTAQLYSLKTVKLEVPTVGELPENLELASIDAPATILLAGPSEDLEKLDKVSAAPIDLSRITASTEMELDPDISGNVRMSVSQNPIRARITVKKKNTRNLSYSVEDIRLENRPEKAEITFDTQSVSLDITGTETALDKISTSDFTLSADCSDLQPGENTVKIKVRMSENAKASKVSVAEPEVRMVLHES